MSSSTSITLTPLETPPENGTAIDYLGQLVDPPIEWNSPTSIVMVVAITYDIFDSSVYPEDSNDAEDAVKAAVVSFGNSLPAGANIFPAEFEGTIYTAVSGISNVMIDINGTTGVPATNSIVIASDEKGSFAIGDITVVGTPI